MIRIIRDAILPAAYTLLPPALCSTEATAMLLAIGLQESHFVYRRQRPNGPARGFWQFERAGVRGVMTHERSRVLLEPLVSRLRYPFIDEFVGLHRALEHNDVLAALLARCLLWTDPGRLRRRNEWHEAWMIYERLWRPGRPHPETWNDNYTEAWAQLDG